MLLKYLETKTKNEKESVKYEPGMVSCAGVEWATEDQEIDFTK